VIFTGHAELTIDDKGRLQIPSKHRAIWRPERDGNAWYCVPWRKGLLMLFTEARFMSLAEKGPATLTPPAQEGEAQANYFGLTERLELDSAGRVMIPRLHMGLTGLSRDVVVVGAGPRLEVWDKKAWMDDLDARFRNLPDVMNALEKRGAGQSDAGRG
jgi:MraZ protein